MASVLVRCCSSRDRSTSSLLICADCMRRMHRVQGAADDVTALLIAALTASTHANRPALHKHLLCGALTAAALQQMVQPEALQRLWC